MRHLSGRLSLPFLLLLNGRLGRKRKAQDPVPGFSLSTFGGNSLGKSSFGKHGK
jgi:hypothetical protein